MNTDKAPNTLIATEAAAQGYRQLTWKNWIELPNPTRSVCRGRRD